MTIDPNDQALVDSAVAAVGVLQGICGQIDAAMGGKGNSALALVQNVGNAPGLVTQITLARLRAQALGKLTEDERRALLGY